jgi:hypothetical protein
MRHQDAPVEHVKSEIESARRIACASNSVQKEIDLVKEPGGRRREDAPSHNDGAGITLRDRGVQHPEHWLFRPAVTESKGRGGRSLVESGQTPPAPQKLRATWHVGVGLKNDA